MSIVFGAKYRDVITGYEGVATGHCRYISGCHQVLLAGKANPDGSMHGPYWFDEQRCECVSVDGMEIKLDNGATPGCDIPAPVR